MGLKYESVPERSRDDLVKLLRSEEPRDIASAIYSAARYDPDDVWVEELCMSSLTSPDVPVRWAAVTCLGDLAFFHNRKVDFEKIGRALEQAISDVTIRDPAEISLGLLREAQSRMKSE